MISSLEVAFDIELSWLNAESPRALYSRVLLVAILVRAIIKFDKLKVGLSTMLFQKAKAHLVLELNEVLQMNSTFFALLQLTSSEDGVSLLVPGAYVGLTRCGVGIVKRSDKHSTFHSCLVVSPFIIILIKRRDRLLI